MRTADSSDASSSAGRRAVVNVSVATLWTEPGLLRPVDAPSASTPVHMSAWLSALSVADREWLVGKVETQALYGTAVTILQERGRWSKVAVEGQPTNRNPDGYPGWLPTRQLTRNLSLLSVRRTHQVAIVRGQTASLRDPSTLAARLQVSFGTRLSVVGSKRQYLLVATPTGGRLAVARSAVSVYRSVDSVPRPSRSQVVSTAKMFLGLWYLWGGTSGFGFDCSGLTHSVYARFGITIPRDADRQAVRGVSVPRSQLQPGDLLFFAGPGGTGAVHHVAMYVGSDSMIHAPNSRRPVIISPISSMGSEYAGARRYL